MQKQRIRLAGLTAMVVVLSGPFAPAARAQTAEAGKTEAGKTLSPFCARGAKR